MLVNHISAFRLRKYIIAYFAGIINIPEVNLDRHEVIVLKYL